MELRLITQEDSSAMLKLLTDRQVRQTYMLPDFEREADAAPLFRRLMQLSRAENHFVRGIFSEGRLVGFLNDVEIRDGMIELGYVISPDHWGKGCATQALKLAIAELCRLGYREVWAGAFEENAASIRVMEKAGMTRTDRQETVEYRGSLHACVYCKIIL